MRRVFGIEGTNSLAESGSLITGLPTSVSAGIWTVKDWVAHFETTHT